MEITDRHREELGANLWAAQVDNSGRESRSYSLAKHVRPGDLILHWSKQAGPAILAYSHVTGPLETEGNTWRSRGTYGGQRSPSSEKPVWLVPLSGAQMLRAPVTQQRLRELEEQVRQVRDDLTKSINGPLYFPYALSDRRPVRAAEAYLTKFPYDLVAIITELSELRDLARAEPGEQPQQLQQSVSRSRTLRGGRQSDAELRRAIERYAVETVSVLYRKNDYHVEYVGDRKSWDITVYREPEEIHIEVKGSAGPRHWVDLTDPNPRVRGATRLRG